MKILKKYELNKAILISLNALCLCLLLSAKHLKK